MNPNFKKYILNITKSTTCEEVEVIQSLWSGYGKISRYKLESSKHNTVVVKYISLNKSSAHPRGWNTDYSHNRKVKSYKVETYWYEKWSGMCSQKCKVPNLIGSFSEGNDQWIILEDLNLNYPLRKYSLSMHEVKVCLDWLAHFHVTFLNHDPAGLWDIGTYWHLETRPDEFKKIAHGKLKSKAKQIDTLLNQCKFQTIVHGDAKLANFCFSEDGKLVAAVDFQYVGGGCGMKDVAYFLGSCLSSAECDQYQDELLDFYFSRLKNSFDVNAFEFEYEELELEWRNMYPIACTDFTRFLMGWMPSHQKINSYNLKIMNSVLERL